jgi:hypothetical protein
LGQAHAHPSDGSLVQHCFHARREQRRGIRAQTAGDATPALREAERQQPLAKQNTAGKRKRGSLADAASLRLDTLSNPRKQIPAEAFHVQAVADVRAATLQPGGVGLPCLRWHGMGQWHAHPSDGSLVRHQLLQLRRLRARIGSNDGAEAVLAERLLVLLRDASRARCIEAFPTVGPKDFGPAPVALEALVDRSAHLRREHAGACFVLAKEVRAKHFDVQFAARQHESPPHLFRAPRVLLQAFRVFGRVGGPPAHRQIEVRTRPCLSQTGASLTSISRPGFFGMPMSSNVAAPSGSFGQRLQAAMTHAPIDTSRGPSPLRPDRPGHVYSQNARADKILETRR